MPPQNLKQFEYRPQIEEEEQEPPLAADGWKLRARTLIEKHESVGVVLDFAPKSESGEKEENGVCRGSARVVAHKISADIGLVNVNANENRHEKGVLGFSVGSQAFLVCTGRVA